MEFNPQRERSRSRIARSKNRNYLVGIGLLLIVVVLWTTSNFVTQDLYEDGYQKPFLVTYLNTSAFAVYLLPVLIRRALKRDNEVGQDYRGRGGYQALVTEADAAEVSSSSLSESREHTNDDAGVVDELAPLTHRQTVKLAGTFCVLWFVANWSQNISLNYTSVASATILSTMSGFFTLGIGRLFRVETLTLVKIGAVLTSFVGVVMVSLSDSSQSPISLVSLAASAPVIGDILALIGAFVYALYVTLLKVRIRLESRIDMQLFFGYVGLFNILGFWILGAILHLTGMEPFELPTSRRAIISILINMCITISSDYIYVLAMLKTTPLVVTVGLSLTMPLAVFGDFILQRPTKLLVMLGASLVLLSFVAVGLEDSRNETEDDLISGAPLDEEEGTGVQLIMDEEVILGPQDER